MNCPKCGNALPPNAAFCPVCNEPVGAAQSGATGSAAQQPAQGAYGARPLTTGTRSREAQPGFAPPPHLTRSGRRAAGDGAGAMEAGQGAYQTGQNMQGQAAYQPGQPGQNMAGQPMQGQPAYQPGQPAYQPGQPGQNMAGQPMQGQPMQGQPAYQPGQPAYQPGQPGQNMAGQPMQGQSAYQPGQPAYQPGQPAYQPGQAGQPMQGQPAYQSGQPAYQPGQPAYQPGQAGQPMQGQPAYPPVYPPQYQGQPVAPPAQNVYQAGYQQPWPTNRLKQPGRLWAAVKPFPQAFMDCFTDPGALMARLAAGGDVVSGVVVTALALLMAFLCGMVLVGGVMNALASQLMGLSALGGFGYLLGASGTAGAATGRVAASLGGVAALCQLLCVLTPAAVMLGYGCGVCKVRFSWALVSAFVTVTTLPTLAASLLTLLTSLVSPLLPLVVMLCGVVISYAQMGAMIARVTGRAEAQLFPSKLLCLCASLVITALLIWLIGGALVSGALGQLMGAGVA